MKKFLAIAFAAAAMMLAAQAPATAGMTGLATAVEAPKAAPAAAVEKVGFKGRVRIHFGHRFRHHRHYYHGHHYGYRRWRGCGRYYRKYKWTGSYYWLRRYRACKGWY